MRKLIILVVGLLLTFLSPLFGQTANNAKKKGSEELPPIIISGLQAYKEKGPEEAIKLWIKGSPVDGSKEALSQANNLRRIEDFYGSYEAYELVATRTLSSRSKIFYFVLDFQKGPVFGRFLTYKADEGWILTNFDFNTSPDAILPSSVGFSQD